MINEMQMYSRTHLHLFCMQRKWVQYSVRSKFTGHGTAGLRLSAEAARAAARDLRYKCHLRFVPCHVLYAQSESRGSATRLSYPLV